MSTGTDDPLDGYDGELTAENAVLLVTRIRELHAALQVEQAQVEMLERDLKGKRLKIHQLEQDRDARARADDTAPDVEALWRLWKRACHRRRPLHYTDREAMGLAVKRQGFKLCLQAIAGASYDPNLSKPRRNGKVERYDDLELIFRNHGKVEQFAARVPDGWEPDLEKVSEITGESVRWLRDRCETTYDERRKR
jgi:uncharacterized protein YhaN